MFVNPFYFARRGLFLAIREMSHAIRGKVLDVGCGTRPYETLFDASEYIGLELDTEYARSLGKADSFYDGKAFPFDDAGFDAVVCNQVLEHVFEPDAFLKEITRVLKENGQVLLTVPFVWDEHEQPRDFARYSSFGLQALLKRNGLEVIDHRKSVDDVRVIFQMINAYIYKKTETRSAYLNLIFTVLLMAPFNILGLILGWIMPKNSDLFLDNVVVARKLGRQ